MMIIECVLAPKVVVLRSTQTITIDIPAISLCTTSAQISKCLFWRDTSRQRAGVAWST